MSVNRSPLSKSPTLKAKGYGFDADGNPVYVRADGTVRQLSASGSKGEKPKSSFAEEKNALDLQTRKLVGTLVNDPNLSFVQSAQARTAALALSAGRKGSVNDKGALGELWRGITAVPAAVGKGALKVYDTAVSPFQQTGQSLVKELVDIMEGRGANLTDFIKQAKTKDFSAAEAAGVQNKWIKGFANFALDTLFDPTTYLTMGASAASKASRFALANKVALDLVPKYPELKPLLSNIARYGAMEIPKEIRVAEGIASGVKYMGKEVPYSSGLAKAWRHTVSPVRATIGDVVASTPTGRLLLQKTTAESLKDLTLAGFGRKATQNIYKPEFQQGLMEMSASAVAKGIETTVLRKAQGEIAEVMEKAKLVAPDDPTINNVYRAIEAGSDDGLSDVAKEVYVTVKEWTDKLRNEVIEAQYKLGDAYGLEVSKMGYLENHLYHKITPEAKAWTLGRTNVSRSGYRSGDMTAKDLLETNGTMLFRKLRPPVLDETGKVVRQSEFLGVPLTTPEMATIDGLNKISMDELGFKWFSDDLGDILQGYAESVAKTRSRIAYVNRAMGYGADAIKPMVIKEIVPDEELVADLVRISKILAKEQKRLRTKVRNAPKLAGTREGVAGAADDFGKVLQDVLDGRYMERSLVDSEIDSIREGLNEVWEIIDRARTRSLTLSEDAKGEFEDLWGGYLRQAEELRDAISSNTYERYAIGFDLRNEYARLSGMDAGAEALDDKPIEWFAERINRMRNDGQSSPREQAKLLKRRDKLRYNLDELGDDEASNVTRNRILDELESIDVELEGVQVLSDVRANASYADDGVIWGSVPDATDVEAPFQVWTTRPVDDEFGTFGRMPDSLMGHAIPEEDLVDFRNPMMMQQVVSPETVSDTIGRVWREAGIEDPTWASVVDEAFATGQVDETLRIVSPAKAEMLEEILNFSRMVDDAVDNGVDLTEFEIESFFGFMRQNFQAVAREFSVDNSDAVANGMLNDFIRGLTDDAVDSGFRGTLVPMRTIFNDVDDIASEWAVVLPRDTPTPTVGGGVTDEWQTVVDNPLAESLLRGSKESYELDLISKGDKLRTEGLDLQALREAREALEKELDDLANPDVLMAERMRRNSFILFDGKMLSVKQAKKMLAGMDETLARESKNVDRQIDNIMADFRAADAGAGARALELEDRLPILLNNARAIARWDATMGTALRTHIDGVVALLARKPAKGSTGASNAAWVRDVERHMADSALLDFDPALKDAYDRVITLVHAGEAELGKIDGEIAVNAWNLSKARSGELGKVIFEDVEKGWEELKGMGVQVPDIVAAKWQPNLEKLRRTEEAAAFFKTVNALNNYWKRYVTASVGFFVRNGLSGQFMNYADGVPLDTMNTGFRWAAAQYDSKGRRLAGNTYDNWMERAKIDIANPNAVAEAEFVQQVVAATGRGQSDDFAIPMFGLEGKQGNVVKRASNQYLGFFSRKNDFVENALRIPMALDSFRQGMSFDEAVARIRRVHFDYTDLSAFDEKMKKVVPFWIWTSRNIPLQVAQMATRPKAYVQYERIKKEFPVNQDLMVPSWIQKSGPLGAGMGSVLTPDLPMVRLAQNLKDITTPSGLVGQMTPLLRVPVELWLDRQVALDIPFGDKRTAQGVESAVAKVLYSLTGTAYADYDSNGKMLIDPRVTYVIEQALPTLAQGFRLTGGKLGGKESLEERWIGNVLNWFGVPYRQIGEQQQRGEAIRRQFEMKDLEKQLEGIIESNKAKP
jgi:hypothetical protein